MIGRVVTATACAAALAFALAPAGAAASAAAPSSCLAFAHGMGTLLGNGATILHDAASGYVPLIEQAAEAGIDNSASEISAVAKKTSAVDKKIAVVVGASRATTKQVVADGKACDAAAPSCVALTKLGGQLLGVLATATGDAASYRSLITAAAKAGHDENVKEVDALVSREEKTTSAIAVLNNKLVKLESNIHPLESACHG